LRINYLALLLATAVTLCSFSPSADAKINLKKLEKQNWGKVTTDNFTVISDQGEKTAFKLAEKLEMFRKTYALIGSVALPEDARPIKVISVKRNATYKLLTANSEQLKNTVGFFNDTVSGFYAVIRAGKLESKSTARQTATSNLFHEYTHYLASSLSTVKLPYWYNEGLADYLGETKFPDPSNIKLGLPIEYHLYNLNQMRWKPIEEIFKATHISHKERNDRYRIYSQSWLTIHYLKNDTQRSKQLKQYLDLLHKGEQVDQAFQQSFGIEYAELDKQLKRYMLKRKYNYTQLVLKQPWNLQQIESTKLAPEDVLFELGEVLLNGRNALQQAELVFKRVLEIDPQHASALAGLANIYMFDDLELANTTIERAQNAQTDDPWVSTIAGHINARYAKDAVDESQKTHFWNKAVQNYNHAINSGGTNLEAISSAASLYFSSGRYQKAKELVEFAYSYAPSNFSLRQQMITAHFALGEIEAGEQIVQLVKRNNHMSEAGMANFDKWVTEVKSQLSEN